MISNLFFRIYFSPILFVAKYKESEYYDGSLVAACLTEASNEWSTTFFLMIISLFFLIPLIILIILYAIIAKNLISNDLKHRIRLSKPEVSLKARKQVVMMLGAVVLSFFVCLLPFRVLTLWIIIESDETFQQMSIEKYYSILYFCRIMWYLNSAVNPILYNLMSTKFRNGFLKLCLFSNLQRNKIKKIRKNTQNTAITNSTYLASTVTSSTVYKHKQHLSIQRKISEKLTLSLDDLRLIDLVVRQENSYQFSRQSSTPILSSSKLKLDFCEFSHQSKNPPKHKYVKHLDSKLNKNYRKQMSFDSNVLFNNNEKRKTFICFAKTTAGKNIKTNCNRVLDDDLSLYPQETEPNIVPLLFYHGLSKDQY